MNWLDMALLIVLALATIGGFVRGLITTVVALAALILGIWLAGRLYVPLSDIIPFVTNGTAARIIAFVLVFVAVMVVAHLVSKLLRWVASISLLGMVDRLGGAALGLAFGAVVTGALLAAWVRFFGINSVVADSAVASILLSSLPMALALLPAEFDVVRGFFR